uniref:ACT domain-containing protein n=1 Tax=Kalanchoe fedtschenkoi TaxID=63787 RepID=A0A7N0V9Q8_KALFE
MEAKVCSDDEEREFQEGETSLMQEIIQTPIQAEVDLTVINHSKLWMKLVFTNRRGGFTQLMEALNYLGLEPTDVSLTTSGGAVLVSLCLEGIYGQDLEVNKIRELLQDIIRNI